ncbi:hypothetical protein BTA51_23130 [Hahella sp. CCB-MM4]|uniref:GreA/GreB family elongation factor n=1 Tax=Hahella sp. (strain CCB-MM4) TaxID=1926491 RepID=UPI000B9C6E64|nr:GreA/GreB family elongation factor [Hahella sp. CCB-MM4]OZG71001.1 hypothetical protein BTA51_23130 [Hahella sp. CCB-MM4]
MIKADVIQQIISQLEDSLNIAVASAKAAHETATHEESVAENKYDTFGLEAAYLAEGLSRQVDELTQALQMYRNGKFVDFEDDMVRLGALVTLESEDGECRNYFLGPAGGGIEVRIGEESCKVVTPTSPLGQAMMGKSVDDEVSMLINGEHHLYNVLQAK